MFHHHSPPAEGVEITILAVFAGLVIGLSALMNGEGFLLAFTAIAVIGIADRLRSSAKTRKDKTYGRKAAPDQA